MKMSPRIINWRRKTLPQSEQHHPVKTSSSLQKRLSRLPSLPVGKNISGDAVTMLTSEQAFLPPSVNCRQVVLPGILLHHQADTRFSPVQNAGHCLPTQPKSNTVKAFCCIGSLSTVSLKSFDWFNHYTLEGLFLRSSDFHSN